MPSVLLIWLLEPNWHTYHQLSVDYTNHISWYWLVFLGLVIIILLMGNWILQRCIIWKTIITIIFENSLLDYRILTLHNTSRIQLVYILLLDQIRIFTTFQEINHPAIGVHPVWETLKWHASSAWLGSWKAGAKGGSTWSCWCCASATWKSAAKNQGPWSFCAENWDFTDFTMKK